MNQEPDANESSSKFNIYKSDSDLINNKNGSEPPKPLDVSKRNSSYDVRKVEESPSKINMYSSLDELDLHLKIKKYEERRNQTRLR